MKALNLAIRADGNPTIGMGHIMRCLSLAKEFQKNGDRTLFISNDRVGIEKITAEGFRSVPADGDGPEAIMRTITAEDLEILIVDSYQVDREYLCALKSEIPLLIYLDDLNQFNNPAEIIINGNYAAERMGYRKPSGQLRLLGVGYNLIREEFKNLPRPKVKPEMERILITMGGTDPANLSEGFIKTLRQDSAFDNIALDVVVGAGNQRYDQLLELSHSYSQVFIHYNVQCMSELMLRADLAISAGGSTLYELCACGTPTLGVIVADNQSYVLTELDKDGYLTNLGWYRDLDMNNLKAAIKTFSYAKRQKISAKMRQLVDGNGTARVREKIVEFWKGKRHEA